MKITLTKTENHMTYLTVEVEEADRKNYLKTVCRRLANAKKIHGFDEDSISEDMLDEHFDKDDVQDELIKEISPEACTQAIKEYVLETEMQPMVRIVQKNPIVFEVAVALKPEVKLCDYKKLKIEPESLEIPEEEVNAILEGLCKQLVNYSSVDRAVEEGDLVNINIEGKINETTFINGKDVKFKVTSEYSLDLPGVYKEMIGMSKGEEREFKLIFPENYAKKEAAGKEANYKVRVNDVLAEEFPELTDDIANAVAPGVKTLDALKDRIRKNMKKEREDNARPRFENRLMEKLIEESEIKYPSAMLDKQIDGLIYQCKQAMRESCKDEMKYQEQLRQNPEHILRERALPLAEKRVLWSLLIDEVAGFENIDVSDDEVDEAIERMINETGEGKEEQRMYFNDFQNRQNLYEVIKARKTINRLTEIVRVSD
ncbi:MAG: trigger factor [Eubacteriales bacterium]